MVFIHFKSKYLKNIKNNQNLKILNHKKKLIQKIFILKYKILI